MINPLEMVILIVLIVTVGKIVMSRRSHGHREDGVAPEERLETLRLQDEVRQLKERIHVLERIATDKDTALSREIDSLRDR